MTVADAPPIKRPGLLSLLAAASALAAIAASASLALIAHNADRAWPKQVTAGMKAASDSESL